MQRTWLDIGDAPFANEKIQIHQLPPELFAADWIQTNRKQTKELSFKVRLPSDIYKAVFPELSARASADGFNNTGEWIITDEEGGKKYAVYKKRMAAGEQISIKGSTGFLTAITPASTMQPAFDLKPVTSYKTDGAVTGPGITKAEFSGAPRLAVQTNDSTSVKWSIKTGVADIYNITLKYYWPNPGAGTALLTLFDAGGNRMVEQEISLKFTQPGKWMLATVNTGTMINAGHYRVRVALKNAKGLVVSNIEVQ